MSDLISRQAAVKAVEDLPNCYNGYSDTYDKACIIGLLEELPPAQKRKKGRWYEDEEVGLCRCDQCQGVNLIHTPFCPNCGAEMRGEENE